MTVGVGTCRKTNFFCDSTRRRRSRNQTRPHRRKEPANMSKREVDESRRRLLAAMLAVPGGLALGCGADGVMSEDLVSRSEALTRQESMNAFYDIGNVVTIRITMPADQWELLRNAQPLGGQCNFDVLQD